MPEDGVDFFRGLIAALPISCILWVAILKAVL